MKINRCTAQEMPGRNTDTRGSLFTMFPEILTEIDWLSKQPSGKALAIELIKPDIEAIRHEPNMNNKAIVNARNILRNSVQRYCNKAYGKGVFSSNVRDFSIWVIKL